MIKKREKESKKKREGLRMANNQQKQVAGGKSLPTIIIESPPVMTAQNPLTVEQLLEAQVLRRPAPGIRQTPDDPEFAAWWQRECERRRRGVIRFSPARRSILATMLAINRTTVQQQKEQEFRRTLGI